MNYWKGECDMAKSKNEIDKEMMYRKIMPTVSRPLKQSAPFAETETAVPSPQQTNIPVPAAPVPASVKGAVNRTSAASMQIQESRNMILVNVMEDLVLSKLDSTLARFNCCKCNKCKKDIAAVALNRLTPRYMVMKEDDAVKRHSVEEEYGSEVTSALIQAILIVKKAPRH